MTPTISATKKPSNKTGRQTNNSLSSITGNIYIENTTNDSSSGSNVGGKKMINVENENENAKGNIKTKKNINMKKSSKKSIQKIESTEKKNDKNDKIDKIDKIDNDKKDETNSTETEEVLQIGMHKVLEHVKNHKDAWPFMDPVEEDIAPRYYSIIRRPMDLQQMEERLNTGQYKTFNDFRNDFKLIVNNCRLYNGQNNEYTEMVNNLQHAFEKATKKYFEQNSSDEEDHLEYPVLKTNVFREKNQNQKNITPKIEEIIGSRELAKVSNKKKVTPPIEKVKSPTKDEEKQQEKRGRKRKQKIKDKKEKHGTKVKTKKTNKQIDADSEIDDNINEPDEEEIVPKKKIKKGDNSKSVSEPISKLIKTKKQKSSHIANDETSEVIKKKSTIEMEKMTKEKEVHSNSDKGTIDNEVNVKKKIKKPRTSITNIMKSKRKLVDSNTVNDNNSKKQTDKHTKSKKKKLEKKLKKKTAVIKQKERSRSPSNDSSLSSVRSASPTINFSVDLHKKYSESASRNSLDENIKGCKKKSQKTNRSPSPSVSQFSSELSFGAGSPTTKIKDKFDLIKERRNRANSNNDEKWTQIVKNVAKIKDNNTKNGSNSGPKNQEKNQKLKETIEKLKLKSKQNKNLLKNIIEPKSSNQDQENTKEKSAFDLLRDEKYSSDKKKSKIKADIENELGKKSTLKIKKKSLKQKSNKKNNNNSSNNANMEALEQETEQTLKDINRWLEHTPRFPDFNSDSNSPSRYHNLLDDFDAVTSKLDPADFGRPSVPVTDQANDSKTNKSNNDTPKDVRPLSSATISTPTKQTIQLASIPVPPASVKRDKESKKKSTLKEKLSSLVPKHVHRTIERLQPGKTKGNLIGTIQNSTKVDDSAISNSNNLLSKTKDIIQNEEKSGPKLSLGTVLNTDGFGLGQQHNFSDNATSKVNDLCEDEAKDTNSDDMEIDETITSIDALPKEKNKDSKDLIVTEKSDSNVISDPKSNDKTAMPNLNAWLKAFGVSKKLKKLGEDEVKKDEKLSITFSSMANTQSANVFASSEQNFTSPAPRMIRKASTGSTISERSSFSQDPDSPRIGIDERLSGAYPAPYPSPMGASPVMNSPKEDSTKSDLPFTINGAIRVGFYQDTTTKSSPEKSCSPREQSTASSYSNYAQHLYVSTAATSTILSNKSAPSNNNLSFISSASTTPQTTTSLGFNNKNKTPSYFDQYNQPKSQDSDYNSSTGSNPNSPYQNQHSPYQAESYQQSQTSSYGQNSAAKSDNTQTSSSPNVISIDSPNSPHSSFTESVAHYQNQQPAASYDQIPSAASDSRLEDLKSSQTQQTQSESSNYLHESLSSEVKQPTIPYPQRIQSINEELNPNNIKAPIMQHQQIQPSAPIINTNISNIQNEPILNQQLGSSNINNYMGFSSIYSSNSHQPYTNLVDTAAGMTPMLMPTVANKMSPTSGKADINDDDQRELLNLDSSKTSLLLPNKSSSNVAINKPPHGFDYNLFDPMTFNKDMNTSKALEMYNRAATMSFSKTFTTSMPGDKMNTNDIPRITQPGQPSLTINPYSQHTKQTTFDKPNDLINIGGYPIENKNPHHGYGQPQLDSRYDMSYKPNIFPTSDDVMNGCYYQKEISNQGPYDKSISSQTTNVNNMQQIMKTPSYNATRTNETHIVHNSPLQQTTLSETKPKRSRKKKNIDTPVTCQTTTQTQQNQIMHQQASLHQPINDQLVPQASTTSYHHHQQQQQQQQQMANQGFQSYGLKPINVASSKGMPPIESSAIALKTSSSIVPGSAFNFGPTSTNLGLAPGIYGENTSYLDDYRSTANPYAYLPQSHRNPVDQNVDGSNTVVSGASPTTAPTYHQFIPHPSTRGAYPFMNNPLEPNSQFYQYMRNEEYRQARMILNQGILGNTPSSYAQSGYHPSIGMHNTINRPPWFP